ncbi:26262_t:CDS:10 [Dentiscutata erythropus]|uniref:26262_t:CDS:1 n=1 Tax=Dentiscutata erythropus TaxID=1348616 RepID=A0A9N8VB36_9GLOM|nr:26262_t:CDS:10 [Dentiscutata erythropus]
MPQTFGESMQPLVVGNVEELGYWKRPKTKLHQIDINSTYWASDPIKIYKRDYSTVKYKYAFYRPKEPQQREIISSFTDFIFGDKTIVMEGDSEMDDRVLSSIDNQYDIWKTNHSANLYSPSLNNDFRFFNVIYESVTLENFKNKVMEFQSILKYQQTIRAIEMDSIYAHLSNSPNECQKILICVMLACHIDSAQQKAKNHNYMNLPKNFHSADLLRALHKVQFEDLLPSDAKILFTNVTSALVRHNSSNRGLFDWMKMFAVAHIFDQDYMFISHIKRHEYKDKDGIQLFYNLLKTNVKPHIDQINKIDRPFIYKKVIKAIITISFFEIESCDFLVNEIIGKENMDQEIREFLGENISKNLNSNNPCMLEHHFKSLTEDLQVECVSAFRKDFKKFMYNIGSTWNAKDSESMFRLFSQLFTSEPDIVEILDLLSKSTNLYLLQSFPKWLKSVLELKDNIRLSNNNISSNNISSICNTWYSSIIAAMIQEGQNNIVIAIYKQLSSLSFILEKRFDIYKRLLSIIEKRISNIPIDWFLRSTSFVGNLEPYIIKDFTKVFNEKLNPLIGATDDKLITIIAQICDSSAPPLNIPNQLCEDTICFILDIILNKAKISGDFNISNDEQQSLLFGSSKFWIFLLNANGKVNKLHSHQYVKYVRSQISQLVYSIRDNSIQFGLLKTLLESKNYDLTSYFNAGLIADDDNEENLITDDTLRFLKDKSNEHSDIIKQLFFFYNKWCDKTDDAKIYLDDLNKKVDALNSIPFFEILTQNYWSPHKIMIIEVSQSVFHYAESQIFTNIVEKNDTKDDEIQLSVSHVADTFINKIINQYKNTCQSYKNWKNIKYSDAQELWKGIVKEQVKRELEIMASETSWKVQNDLIESIEFLALIPAKTKQLDHLSKVLNDQFEVKNAKKSWVVKMMESLKKDDMKLSELSGIFRKLNNHLNELSESSWSVIKELSLANDFIKFLLEKLIGNNLTNFINDTKPLKEATVAALIEVNKALKPLNENAAKLSTIEFLNRLHEVSQKNPSLAGKIKLCGSNNLAIKNMHLYITSKGEVTKERIKNAATIGIYIFKHNENLNTCELTLKYAMTQSQNENSSRIEKSYNMADLHDLYSRALLIGKSRTSTEQLFDDSNKDIRSHVHQLVTQIDLAQHIVTIASRLIQSGHFLYQKICIEKHGSELKHTLTKLSHDLEIWKDVVDRAQNEHYYLTFFSARHILTFYDYFKSISSVRNNESNETNEFNRDICQNLVRFVNDAAHLPGQTDEWPTIQNENDFLPVLRKIGATLYNIFNGIERKPNPIHKDIELVVADMVFNGKLFVADCHSYSLVPNVILSLFVNHGSFPKAWQILICRSTTTDKEISLFIKHKEKDYLLALICTREKSINHHILEQFTEYVHPTNGLDEGSMKLLYSKICKDSKNSVCVTSNMSGQGKTEWIKESSFKKQKVLRTLLISDKVSFEALVKNLANFKLETFESLHIDINLISHSHDVNFFLFQLLTFGIVFNEMDIVNLPDTLFFIEIASTVGQYLFESLSLIKYIRRQHIEWDLKKLIVPHHINSPIQIVSYYMDAHSRNALDDINIRLTGTEAIREPLPTERCQELLRQYFFRDQLDNIFSYRFLEIFVNVLADQLVRLSASSFFQVEQLRLMTKETKIRSSLFEILISCSKEFATRAINTKDMQKVQKENAQKENNQDIDRARLGNIVQWNDSNHLIVAFLSQMPNSICALYRDKTKVPKNVENLLKSQKAVLQDYHKMESAKLLEVLERLARRKMQKLEGLPEYALSIENLLKMAMILLRTRANIPVVCCGEAGCGKTSLISYLAKIMEVNFETLDFHAGIQECDISNSINVAEKLANEGETWLFLDEINTCNHIGILGSLISHRIFNGKPIHPNIRIFAACNPYRLRTKSQSDVGLSAKLYEEKNQLVYQVHPLPDQILDYVWDYGYLKAEDEKNYIDIMVKTKLGHSFFAELLYSSQAFIRNVEEPFSVSLRDVNRAIKLFKFFKKHDPSTEHIIDPLEIRPMVLALSLCYLFRLHNPSQRKKYREEIIAIIEKYQSNHGIDLFEKTISKEQDMYTKGMQLPEGTALNEALLENILVMIVCILTRIPVFIIGAPGSSKSLAVRIISMNLRGADSNKPYFQTLPQVYIIPYQGSTSSTSEGIIKVFETAKKYQEVSTNENPVRAVVLLDEVGLAETSPHNPLKVLHSLLEPPFGSKKSQPVAPAITISKSSQPVVPVIGISNWRLDNSKSSRALLIQRPLFSENDLVDTAKCLLGDSKVFSNVISNFNEFLKKLAKAYLHYIEHQKYQNFHGLRDYYSLIKSIKSMDKEKLKENFHRKAIKQFVEKFSTNIQNTITTLTPEILQLARRLYFKDFIKTCSANTGYLNESDVKLLEFIFRSLCNNEIINDPVRLHIFWWDNSDSIIAELGLARMCPSISEPESNLPEGDHFGDYVINEIVNLMLGKITSLKYETIDELIIANYLGEWQRQVINVLSLCANIENSLESKILQFLRICNDLVSNQSINISDIIDTISIQQEPDPINILSQEFVDSVLKLFDMPATERNNTSQCSFFRRCFDIIPIDSPVRIRLYETLFGQEPHTFIGSILSRVLLLEEDLQKGIFVHLIQNAKAVLGRSPRLKAINNALKNSGIDSPVMALCCDVMQNDFFTEWTFKDLKDNFKEAFDVLCSNNFEPLQLVLAVALLKEFVNVFWNSLETLQTIETEPIKCDADIEEVIDKIDHAVRRQSSLIYSFKLYFLRSLYDNGLSLHGIKCFCNIQSGIFQWLTDFNWDESNNKIGFIAYHCYDQYIEAEEAFNPLYLRGQPMQFENFLNQALNNFSTSIKMAIMGTLITHLYDIRAIRGLSTNEETAIQWLQNQLPNMQLDEFYRAKLLSFLENTNPLYNITPETIQTDLLIRSVIIHIIALHSCIPASNSPLAAYLRTLRNCKNTYILASCVDTEIADVLVPFINYECQCGYKYIINGTVQKSICPQCGSSTKGVKCIVNLGKRRNATQGLNGSNEEITQLGYVYESIESRKNINFRLRNLTPVSYCILHLFVHVLIAAASNTDQWDFFNNPQQNNENQNHEMIDDPLDYCQQHIENDWLKLTLLFDCDDEALALILHSILRSMSESQIETTAILNTVEKRQAWENEFTQLYIKPKVTNALRTANDLKKLMTKNLSVVFALFEERNESLHLCKVIEFLANLQNEFLQQVLAVGHDFSSLKFLGGQLISDSENMPQYQNYVESLFLSEAHAKNIINYTWNPKLLSYNQCGLEFGHGQEIQYELHKIEAELAYKILYNKVYLKKNNDSLWLDVFQYHMELLSSSKTNLREIRALIPQEQISTEKLGFFTATTFTSTINRNNLNIADMSLIFDNPAKLLSELEILLCFLKRTSGGDPEMEITKYYDKWMKLSEITENLQFHQVVTDLSQQMKDEINAFVDFEQSHVVGRSGIKLSKITHRNFELALKRFMFRYLSSELYDPDEKLTKYLAENNDEKNSSDCWPLWVSNGIIIDKFPKSLLVANIYNAYKYIQSVTKSNLHKTNNRLQNNSRQNKKQRNKTSNTTNSGTNSRTKHSFNNDVDNV